ncbi:PLC-like phosphodiesterase [Mycena sanguinolenta]|uniref:PLC-like phosphodiesterase n=1 Tax=Mycena sanguinolenta TaxID=230812 RepID=A0A8H6XEX3_9AGAR|nr:PLC-like phosphodiesterase [Mycena sanguinolenta]
MFWSSKRPLVQVALSLFIIPLVHAATTCNGHSELCDRSYGNVSFVGAHDSYAVGTNNLAANQDYDVTQQLTDGVRLLQMQAHNLSGVIQLCHTDCGLFNGGTLQDYLTKVKTWMDANTNDVVTLLIVNIDDLPPTDYSPVFENVGLDKLSYAPTTSPLTNTAWPTLGSMIDAGTRLVTFLDNAADLTKVPYLLDEFTNVWETPFDVTDPAFDCSVNRTHGDSSTQMYLINHFLDTILLNSPVPDIAEANVTNGVSGTGSLGAQVDTCVAAYGRAPNYLLVDFYEYGGGSVFQVAASINGVTYDPTTPIATPIPTSTTSSTSGGGNGNAGSLVSPSQFIASLFVGLSVLFGAISVV